ncbi:MAG TPA: TIGR03960 family B12-binding radical SAM protein [Methylomusa anaerophila]|uniref:(Dimethylallyl)adenosine tRNA methylthiotransferase MiaB n=1 Tax=Methylomusa anaerophila TaxID=1930071 RepID=A0A348AQ96_9FIRM|nr:TIGR03960 family B12-binding radical SAM protein [Methylomusa anaerophila]BBB93244.1 (Dimethylallyl)adenosine tRNA methylthiotransferase MiaB [Methylomusa anaerophila]HML86924.1 TIGR03960 family B12-binding radical SAM protein [Methylomusa anaerophila]
MSWNLREQLKKTVASERGTIISSPGFRQPMALIYPNSYHVGMSNLGLHIIYEQINGRGDTRCERFFLPEKKVAQEYMRTKTPLLSLENQLPLYEFPLIAFAVSFEMDYFNMLSMLALGKVPIYDSERGEEDPLVIIGGPCATFNPEPLADFVDVCIVGEGEEVIHELLDTYYLSRQQNVTREGTLLNLAQIEGLYIPSLYKPLYNPDGTIAGYKRSTHAPLKVKRRYVKNLERYPAETVVVAADTEFKDMYLIEVARGCGRHCRFCMAGYCFRQPRVRSLESILQAVNRAKRYCNKVGLMGAAISDYPQIDKLCKSILADGMTLSVASLRADTLTSGLAQALAASGHRTITLAPEAGSEKMRRIINKQITDEELYAAVAAAIAAGIPNVRLYVMVGLPGETEEDIQAIIHMAVNIKENMRKLGSKGTLTLSINPFIPKPFTPFQWLPMAYMDLVTSHLKHIQASLKSIKGIEVLIESPKEAYIQGVLSRGDRRLGKVLFDAVIKESGIGWRRAAKENNLDEAFYLYRKRDADEVFPWDNLDMGFDRSYLIAEYGKAQESQFTAPCKAGCKRCGVCD